MTIDMSTWRTGCYLTLSAAHFTNIKAKPHHPAADTTPQLGHRLMLDEASL